MKELHGAAATAVGAAPSACLALVREVEGYPRWHPEVVRDVDALGAGAAAQGAEPAADPRYRTTLHAQFGPLERDFELLLELTTGPDGTVALNRVPHGPDDAERLSLLWRIAEQRGTPGQSEVAVELTALLDVPRLLPTAGVGDRVAQGFLDAARRALES